MKNTYLYIFMIKIFLLTIVMDSYGQIAKVFLSGNNLCNNRLEVGIYVRASDFSSNNFEIGSSTFFLNYDPEVVSFVGYTPSEFNASTSNQAANANWIDQAISTDDECGIIHLVLQKEDGGANNYLLDKNNFILVGRALMEFVDGEADPDIRINQRFTMFNSGQPNDGTAMVDIEDYPKVLDYACTNNCTPAVVNNVVPNGATCGTYDGSIAISFLDDQNRTNIEFSIDGGLTYPFSTTDDIGTYSITGLGTGSYDLWIRWGNDECPYSLGNVSIMATNGPEVNFSTTSSCSGTNQGTISLEFPDHSTHTSLKFSIDGGLNYDYYIPGDVLTLDITGLAVGTYDLWVRWGDDSCPTDLGNAMIYTDDPPEVTVLDYDICGTSTTGSIVFNFTDLPNRSNIKFSIDGGSTYPHNVADSDLTLRLDNIAAGTYNCWVRWGNDDCPVDLGNIIIGNDQAPIATVTKDNACIGSDEGEIIFEFPDYSGRTGIAFSIDGGTSYQYTSDDTGTYIFTNLAPGTYDCWVTWGNDECPVPLGTQTIGTSDPPTATAAHTDTCPNTSEGTITISFPDHPSRTGISFSIDGGASYQNTQDNLGTYEYTGLGAGTYPVWARWGDGDCATYLGDVVIQNDNNLPNCTNTCLPTGDTPVTIHARGREGTETMILHINGVDVATYIVTDTWADYTYTHQGGIYQLQVHLVDALYEQGVIDHNLYVDYVTVDTQTIETNAPSTYGTAVRTDEGYCKTSYDFENEALYCNGYLEYSFGSPVTIRARGDEGSETMKLEINEIDVATWENVSATWQDYTMNYYGEVQSFRVHGINMLYDPSISFDENLRVDYVTLAGKTMQTNAPSTYGSAVKIGDSWCASGYNFEYEVLPCNGYFEYDFSTPITIRARGKEGAEIMVLHVNGVDVKTWENVADTWQDYTFKKYGNINLLRVYFTNDYYEPGVIDHNLYVDYITVGAETIETNAPSTYGTAVRIGDSWCASGYNFETEHLLCNGYFEYINNCGAANKVEEEEITTFTLYPNPATNFIHIDINIENVEHNGKIVLYDMNGQYLYEQEIISKEMTVPTHDLPAGMYLIRLNTNDGTQAVKRFVKLAR